jgi:hypothetical protein
MARVRAPACRRLSPSRLSLIAAAALAVTGIRLARAQPEPPAEPTAEERAAARALFQEVLEHERKGEWNEALLKLDKIAGVKMTPQVRYHIALCHEHLGRFVEAINGFELAAQEAAAAGPTARAVVENAPARAEELRKRVARVRITVRGKVRTSRIFVDDRPFSLSLLDTEVPIDPGSHALEVRREARVIATRSFQLGETERTEIALEIDDPEPPPPPKPTAPPPSPPPPDEPSRLPAYVVGGIGVAGLVGGAVMFGVSHAIAAEVNSRCKGDAVQCDPDDEPLARDGFTLFVAGQIVMGVGAAALLTGVVLYFVLEPDAAASASATLVLEPGGAALRGRF